MHRKNKDEEIFSVTTGICPCLQHSPVQSGRFLRQVAGFSEKKYRMRLRSVVGVLLIGDRIHSWKRRWHPEVQRAAIGELIALPAPPRNAHDSYLETTSTVCFCRLSSDFDHRSFEMVWVAIQPPTFAGR